MRVALTTSAMSAGVALGRLLFEVVMTPVRRYTPFASLGYRGVHFYGEQEPFVFELREQQPTFTITLFMRAISILKCAEAGREALGKYLVNENSRAQRLVANEPLIVRPEPYLCQHPEATIWGKPYIRDWPIYSVQMSLAQKYLNRTDLPIPNNPNIGLIDEHSYSYFAVHRCALYNFNTAFPQLDRIPGTVSHEGLLEAGKRLAFATREHGLQSLPRTLHFMQTQPFYTQFLPRRFIKPEEWTWEVSVELVPQQFSSSPTISVAHTFSGELIAEETQSTTPFPLPGPTET